MAFTLLAHSVAMASKQTEVLPTKDEIWSARRVCMLFASGCVRFDIASVALMV